ncbi:hypothetical protein QQ056_00415 [Oscillatoria laete-virens NRMC-F 0139]|nr:hypothetical protein [Oscillatoria laete-virens]MDL5052041.1 hypothetical protein [Oscillatoria laete-virens NRMC-F 0139]
MISGLFVPKSFHTYADSFLLLGLARLAVSALNASRQKADIQLIDEGARYRIQFKRPMNLETMGQVTYFDFFPFVCGQKSDRRHLPESIIPFNTVEQTEARKLYRNYLFQSRSQGEWSEVVPPPPDPSTQNGVLLTSMRHDRNHNALWLEAWEVREQFGALLMALFESFSQPQSWRLDEILSAVAARFEQQTGQKFPTQASAVKVFLPTAVQGVNRTKADSNKVDSQKTDWLSLWLIAGGLFNLGLAERIKVADRVYDWRVVALEPRDIQWFKYQRILDDLRRYNPPGGGHGTARFDAELVLRFCLELLKSHEAEAIARPDDDLALFGPANHFVSGFVGTHFGQKGQVYGVKEVFTLLLPGWVQPSNYQELQDYQAVLREHLMAIASLAAQEGHSELLAAYRDFITSNTLRKFFPFQVAYADFVVKRLADPKAKPPRLFSVDGLNLMTQKDRSFTQITQDPSFLRIAKAINQATVYAGRVQTKEGVKDLDWQRNYGLAQQLSSQSGSKKDFLVAIADFLAKYEHENLRLSEQLLKEGKRLMRVWTTKDDLDRLVELVEEFDTVLVANLLIAYGYARWGKAKADRDDRSSATTEPDEDLEHSELEGDNNE